MHIDKVSPPLPDYLMTDIMRGLWTEVLADFKANIDRDLDIRRLDVEFIIRWGKYLNYTGVSAPGQTRRDAADSRPSSSAWLERSLSLLQSLGVKLQHDGRQALLLGPKSRSGDPLIVLAYHAPEWFVRHSPWSDVVALEIFCSKYDLDNSELGVFCTCNRARRRHGPPCQCDRRALDELIADDNATRSAVLRNLGRRPWAGLGNVSNVRHRNPSAVDGWRRSVARTHFSQRRDHDRKRALRSRNRSRRQRK